MAAFDKGDRVKVAKSSGSTLFSNVNPATGRNVQQGDEFVVSAVEGEFIAITTEDGQAVKNSNGSRLYYAHLFQKMGAVTDDAAMSAASKRKDVEFVLGDRIEIPKNMSEDEAILWLKRRKEDREKVVQLTENIEGSFPTDAALALARVLKRKYGWVSFTGIPGFFFDKPPTFLSIPSGVGVTEEAPIGTFQVPGIDGKVMTSFTFDKHQQPMFQMIAQAKNKDRDRFREIADEVRREVREHSIYKAHAIKVDFPHFDPRNNPYDPQVHVPQFLDVAKADPAHLIFNREVTNAIDVSIFTPIRFKEAVKREIGTLRRGVLLAGPPGTGKTNTAYVTARMCEQHGWTFVYLEKSADLAQAIQFAKAYQPAVIFAEDLDSLVNSETEDQVERDEATQTVLNTLDGVDSKQSDVMVIFSTNYPDKISKAMLRPGRLDAVISISLPDAWAAERLLRLYGGKLIPESMPLAEVSLRLTGAIPAVIREVVERAKLAAIPHSVETGEELYISQTDLHMAVDSMNSHLAMLTRTVPVEPSDLEKAARVLGYYMSRALRNSGEHEDVARVAGAVPLPALPSHAA